MRTYFDEQWRLNGKLCILYFLSCTLVDSTDANIQIIVEVTLIIYI